MKDNKKNTWIGLSRSVRTTRSYKSIGNIWNMVARTAYTQLNYSLALLLLSTLSLVIAFIIPLLGLFSNMTTCIVSFTTLAFMAFTYRPIIALYNLPTLWTLSLPMSASLFIMMTWTSAIRYWKGERSQWKNRIYNKQISDRGRE